MVLSLMWSLWCLLTQLGSQFNYVNSLMSHYAVKTILQFYPEAPLLSPDTNFHEAPRNLNISDTTAIAPQSASSFKKHLTRRRLGRSETWGRMAGLSYKYLLLRKLGSTHHYTHSNKYAAIAGVKYHFFTQQRESYSLFYFHH